MSLHIMWTPYDMIRHIPPVSLYHGCINFMDHFEAYMPDRVARQFGRIQCVPQEPITFNRSRSYLRWRPNSYKKVYGWSDAIWNQLQYHNVGLGNLGELALQAHHSTPDYDE